MIKKLMMLCVAAIAAMGAWATGEKSVVLGDWYEAHSDNEATTCARWDDFWMGANVAIPVTGFASPISASDVVVTAETYSEFGKPYVLTEAEMWNRYGAPVYREMNLGNVEFDVYDNVWQNWEAEEDGAYGYELSADIWPDWSQVSGRQWILIPTGVPRLGTHTFSVKINGVEHNNYVVSFVMAEDQEPVPYGYQVSFNLNVYSSLHYFLDRGDEVRTVAKGSSIGELPSYMAPSLAGVGFGAFQGWYTSKTGGTRVTEDTIVNGDVTYYGRWKYYRIIEFELNGGELTIDHWPFAESGKAIGALPVPVRDGYQFGGWYTAASGGTKVRENTVITATDANITIPLKYYARWVYDGSIIVFAYVAEGCEAMGKVTGGKTAKAGTKLTLKATANNGYVFAGWDANVMVPMNGVDYFRNPTFSYVVNEYDENPTFVAYFMPVEEDWVDVWVEMDSEYTTGEEIDDIYIGVDSGSLTTIKVQGLPSGLKFTDKPIDGHMPNCIYGTPKKSGVYAITVTATTASKKISTSSAVIVVRKENEKMVKLAVQDWYDEETDTSVIPGKVSGGGIFAEGKKVSLKATANKGFVFAGWWDVANDDWFYGAEDYRNPTLSYVMTDSDTELKAVFAPIAEDNILDLYVEGEWITANADDNVFYADGEVDVKLEIDSLSLPKASVSGLPKGLKFDAKTNMITGMPTAPGLYTVTVKLTNQTIKKAIEKKFTISVSNLTGANDYFIDGLYNGVGEKYSISVGISNIEEFLPSLALNSGMAKLAVSGLPAGLKYDAANGKITGVATKAGTYTVTLTVTDGKAKYVSTITVEIKSLPDWVVGMFEGCFNESGWYNYSNYNKGRGSDWEAIGRFTVSVTKTGKVTGKFVKAHETQSFTAALVNVEENRYEFFADYSVKDGNGWDERGELSFAVIYDEYENTHCARIEGELLGDENNGQDMPFVREFCGWRNLWNVKGISLPKVAKTTAYNMAYADEEYDIYGELSLSFSAGRNTVVASFAFDDFEDQRTLKITKCTSQLIVTGYDETSGVFSVLLPVYMKHLDEPGDDEWIDLDFLIPMEIDIKGNVNILWDDVRYAHDDWW